MNKKIFFMTALILIATSKEALAANEIVDVRRNITLSDDELPVKDFYIKISDGGSLKKNMVVKATRKINVKDSALKSVGDFNAIVGLLKIIHVEGSIAVAREFKLLSRADQPMLEQIGIMSGDLIDLSDSFIDNSKPAETKKKVASSHPVDSDSNNASSQAGITDNRQPATHETSQQVSPAPLDSKNIQIDSIQRDI